MASANSEVVINNTKITNVDANPDENYGAITVFDTAENANVTVSGCTIKVADDSKKVYIFAEGATVTGVDDVGVILAMIGDYGYDTLEEALEDVKEGETIVLVSDITSSEIIGIEKGITLDGNGHTLTSTAARAFNIETTGTVKISNLTVNAGERAFNVINQPANVTLTNVTATAKNNAVMLATSAAGANLTVEGCDFTGLAVINVASANSGVVINNTKITNVDATDAENYGAITIWTSGEGANVTVTNCDITVSDDSKAAYVFPANATITGVEDVGYIIVTVGDAGYDTMKEALEETKAGDTIILVRDTVLGKDEPVLAAGKIIDLNGCNLEADVVGTVKMNGGSFTTADKYKMMAPEGDFFYHTTNAVVIIASDMTTTLVSGDISVGENGQTLPNQKVVVAENAKFTVPEGKIFNVRGQVEVNGTAIVDGTVTLGWETATVKAAEGLNVVSAVEGYIVFYENGLYRLEAAPATKVDVSDELKSEGVDENTVEEVANEIAANTAVDAVAGLDAEENKECIDAAKEALKANNDDVPEVEFASVYQRIDIILTEMEADAEDASVINVITYDVKPVVVVETSAGEIKGEIDDLRAAITFRLPLPSSFIADKVNVYHEDTKMNEEPVEVMGEGANRYVEVTSDEFSPFTVEAVSEETLIELKTNMTLGNSLQVNFLIDEADYQEGYVAKIIRSYADGRQDKEISVTEWTYIDSWKMYYVSFTGVAAKEMGDIYTVTVFDKDGNQVSVTKVDSIKAYAMRTLESSNSSELTTLLVDMLNYGAASQIRFDYDENNLVNADLTAEQQAFATADSEYTDQRVKGEGFYGTTLSLESNIQLNFVYEKSTAAKAAYAKVTYKDHYSRNNKNGKIEAKDFLKVTFNNVEYVYVSVNSLVVADFAQLVTVELYDANGNVISKTVDSIESYVGRSSNPDVDAPIAKFGISAYNYLH